MFDGIVLVKNSTEITDSDVLWKEDYTTKSAISKNGVWEQLGRMMEQDHLHPDDYVFFANKAIDALKAGYTSMEVAKALCEICMAVKKANGTSDKSIERLLLTKATQTLMGIK